MLGSLGTALVYAGRTADGLAAFDRAIQLSCGVLMGRVLHRRGIVLWNLGRFPAALDDFRRAIGVLQRAVDQVWTARALSGRGLVYLGLGSPARADADFVAAGTPVRRNRSGAGSGPHGVQPGDGRVPVRRSSCWRCPFLDEAAAGYRSLNVPTPFLSLDRCAVLLAAGLASEALAEADAAIRDIEQIHGLVHHEGRIAAHGGQLRAGRGAAAGRPGPGPGRIPPLPVSAERLGSGSRRARPGPGPLCGRPGVSPVAQRAASREAVRLEALGSAEATQAHLLAGRVALDLGRGDEADRHLGAAAHSRRRGPAMARASGWLCEALRAEAAADPRRLLGACRRGLAVLDEFQLTLGASELRAQATAHGTELAVARAASGGAGSPAPAIAGLE